MVPHWHESPKEIPATKRPSGWNVAPPQYWGLSASGRDSTERRGPREADRNAGGRR